MRRNVIIALLYTLITTIIFGVGYPLAVTAIAQLIFKDKANGQLIAKNGHVIGSRLLGQAFTAPGYFHSRPSAAGVGYDAANSAGSNYAPTNQKLIDRVKVDAVREGSDQPGAEIPIDLVTTSASGLDPHITPAAAEFQAHRVAESRHLTLDAVHSLIGKHTEGRQLGFLGEPRVNVLELNLDLDRASTSVATLPSAGVDAVTMNKGANSSGMASPLY